MEPSTPRERDAVLLAVIGAPHGVKGDLRVKSFTGDPLALGDYGPLRSADGRRFTVTAIRPQKTVVVVRFREIATREAAEAANGTELFVAREALPADLDEGEVYVADLVGMRAVDESGGDLGRVTAVHNFGGGDILEVGGSGRSSLLIPFTLAAVPKIDLEARSLTVDPAAAGLVDDGEKPPEDGT